MFVSSKKFKALKAQVELHRQEIERLERALGLHHSNGYENPRVVIHDLRRTFVRDHDFVRGIESRWVLKNGN